MSLIQLVSRIHFADRVLEDALPDAIKRLKASRPLVLTDEDGRTGDRLERLLDALPAGCAPETFPNLPAHPGKSEFKQAVRSLKAARCDVIICLGGIAALDFGRFLAASQDCGSLPVIAVPSTAADVGLGPVHRPGLGKAGRVEPPASVLCDPTLTLDTSPERTAAHGFDALTHCIEAFLATAYNPPADGIALEGIHRSTRYLERAVADGDDLEARRELLAVALNAGLAAQKGLGGVEALARAADGECGVAGRHGTLNAALLRPVLQFNAPAVGNRYARIAEAMKLSPGVDVTGALVDLGRRIGLPDRIGPVWTGANPLHQVAKWAAADPANQTNPRHATPDDYVSLLKEAM